MLGSDRSRLGKSFAAQQFRQKRRAGQCRNAPASSESSLRNVSCLEPRGKFENVSAHRIFHGNLGRGAVQGARIARILKMVENCFAIHHASINGNLSAANFYFKASSQKFHASYSRRKARSTILRHVDHHESLETKTVCRGVRFRALSRAVPIAKVINTLS